MSASASRPARAPAGGFTLVEILVGLVVGALVVVVAVKFYKDSYRTYSLQDQLQERDQNAHFVVNKFVEMLQQAGASLPDSGWTVISQAGGSTTIGMNPRSAEQFNGVDLANSYFIPVSDALQWTNSGNVLLNINHVLIDFSDPSSATRKYVIDAGYNSGGFANGIKNNPIGMDSIRITSRVRLTIGDRIYGYREDQFLLSGANLVVRPNGSSTAQMVLAENIDSLGIVFRGRNGAATTSWDQMRSASVTVRARTAHSDPRLPRDGYRKITLPMNVIMRNRK
jgi:type II secretory pathway pseudopilin PulG